MIETIGVRRRLVLVCGDGDALLRRIRMVDGEGADLAAMRMDSQRMK